MRRLGVRRLHDAARRNACISRVPRAAGRRKRGDDGRRARRRPGAQPPRSPSSSTAACSAASARPACSSPRPRSSTRTPRPDGRRVRSRPGTPAGARAMTASSRRCCYRREPALGGEQRAYPRDGLLVGETAQRDRRPPPEHVLDGRRLHPGRRRRQPAPRYQARPDGGARATTRPPQHARPPAPHGCRRGVGGGPSPRGRACSRSAVPRRSPPAARTDGDLRDGARRPRTRSRAPSAIRRYVVSFLPKTLSIPPGPTEKTVSRRAVAVPPSPSGSTRRPAKDARTALGSSSSGGSALPASSRISATSAGSTETVAGSPSKSVSVVPSRRSPYQGTANATRTSSCGTVSAAPQFSPPWTRTGRPCSTGPTCPPAGSRGDAPRRPTARPR